MGPDESSETEAKPALCFYCALRIASRSWALVGLDGSSGVPDIPQLVNGLCPVCEGSGPVDPEEIEG